MTSNINFLTANSLMQNVILEIEITLNDYKSMIETLTTGLVFSHSGHISPTLLPPQVLIKSLKELQKTDYYNMPTFDISEDNFPLIIKISETSVYLDGSKIVTIMKVPIADHEIYSVVKFLAVPQKVGTKYHRMIHVPDRPMFISKDRSKFILSNNEPLKCMEGFYYNHCKLSSNIIRVHNQTTCETSLINNNIDHCDQHYLELLNDFYVTLDNGYQWFVAPTTTKVFNVSCFKNNYKTINFDLISNSILSVRSDCIANNGMTTFTPVISSNFTMIESLNFTNNIGVYEIPENLLPKIHIDPVDTKNLYTHGINL